MSHINSTVYSIVFLLSAIFGSVPSAVHASTLAEVVDAGCAGCQSITDDGSTFSDNEEKRAGGRNFQQALNEKRGGARNFQLSYAKRSQSDLIGEDLKRGGARSFQTFEDKRGGARSFGLEQMKRGGGRSFGFLESNEKRGGARGFQKLEELQESTNKRGGARLFAAGDGSFGKRYFSDSDASGSAEKRGGARPFFGGFGSFKRGGARFFASPYSSGFYGAHLSDGAFGFDKRGGGHRFSEYFGSPSFNIEKNFQIKRAAARNFYDQNDISSMPQQHYLFDDTKVKKSGAHAFGEKNFPSSGSWADLMEEENI